MSARITNADLLAAFEGMTASLSARIDRLEAAAAPVARDRGVWVTKAAKAPAKKAAPKAAKVERYIGAPRALCKATRLAFIAAAAHDGRDYSGWSTKAIAADCVATAYAPAGFRIGEGYTALFA